MVLSANTTLAFIRGEQSEAPVKGTTTLYEGVLLGDSSGYVRGLVAGDLFRGHAAEYIDNSSGSDGDQNVKLYRGIYRLQVTLSGVAITDVGKIVYASADDTLTLTPGSNSMVGVVARYVTTDTAIVEFRTHDIGTLASDLTALLSNMVTVSGASDFTVLQSDITTLKSDNVVNKSNLLFTSSDVVALKSDNVVNKSNLVWITSDSVAHKSNITTAASHITVTRSDLVAARSDIVTNKSNLKVAMSNALVVAAAGDYANVSDIKVTIDEIIDALIAAVA